MKKLTLKKKNRVLWVALFSVALVGLGARVNAELSLRDQFSKDLASELAPDVKAELLGGLNGQTEEVFGLSNIDVSATGLANVRIGGKLQRGSSSSTYIYRVTQYDVESWPVATNTLIFQNTRSTTSSIEKVVFDMTGTTAQVASSSFSVSCGTSTVGFAPAAGIDPNTSVAGHMKRNFINQVTFVTSSQQIAIFDTVTTTVGVNSSKGLLVGPNEYFVCRADQAEFAGRMCNSNGVQCEAVTSTNRGWIANMSVEWAYTEGI